MDKQHNEQLMQIRKESFVQRFNEKPEKGIQYAIEAKFFENDAYEIA